MRNLIICAFLCLFVSCQSKKHVVRESFVQTDSVSVSESDKKEETSENKETKKEEKTNSEKNEWTYVVEYSEPDEQGNQHVVRETFKGSSETHRNTAVSNEKEQKKSVSNEKSKNDVKNTTKKNEKEENRSETDGSLISTSWVFDVFLSILCFIGVLAVLVYLKQKASGYTKD